MVGMKVREITYTREISPRCRVPRLCVITNSTSFQISEMLNVDELSRDIDEAEKESKLNVL